MVYLIDAKLQLNACRGAYNICTNTNSVHQD